MTISSPNVVRRHLAQLAAHIVVALVALVVVGGATRVMEAGLACPDWPLCYGSFLPGGKMNIQVFLEWFHRLDAFLVGIALLTQFLLSLFYRDYLPSWLLWVYGLLVALVSLQGFIGAQTVLQLLPSAVVTSHLFLALTLLSIMSALTQILLRLSEEKTPFWWKTLCGLSLLAVTSQSLIGGIMATSWGAQRCLYQGESCNSFYLHRLVAIPTSTLIIILIITSLMIGGWARKQWPFLITILLLLTMQIFLGIISVQSSLNEPLFRIAHQLIAALLVAILSALVARRPLSRDRPSVNLKDSLMEVCHG